MTHSYQLTRDINQSIFRAYDIRGLVNPDLSEDAVYTIAHAIAAQAASLGETQFLVARDGRVSSDKLIKALVQGLLDSGIDVFDIGALPTPLLYFATHHTSIRSGIMLTGSHNPGDYNGLKIVIAGNTLSEQTITDLYNSVVQQDFLQGNGSLEKMDVYDAYLSRIGSEIKLNKKLKIVVDAGNGIAGKVAPALYRKLGCEVIELFCDIDGDFPNHHPDPSEATNLVDLVCAVRAHKADVGLAFDGDGDRLGVVTAAGDIIAADQQMIIFSRAILAETPGSKIIYDVKCTKHLAQEVLKAQGYPMMCRTGHSLVKAMMKQENAAFAGEMSGHLFFNDRWYGFDDAIYAGARLLEILVQAEDVNIPFSQLPKSSHTPELKIEISDEDKFKFIEAFKQQAKFQHAKYITVDGLRVEFEDGWGLLRPSNTTPALVCRFEADSNQALERIQAAFKREMLQVDKQLNITF